MMVYNNSREVQPDLNGGNELYEEKKKVVNIKFILDYSIFSLFNLILLFIEYYFRKKIK